MVPGCHQDEATIMIKVDNIRTVYDDSDFGNAILFKADGKDQLEFLDNDRDVEVTYSNLHNAGEFDGDEIAEIHQQLNAWLADQSFDTISVAVNGSPDFFEFSVTSTASDNEIAGAIEIENKRIGGEDCGTIYDGYNGVRVFRDGEEISSLRQEEQPRRQAA